MRPISSQRNNIDGWFFLPQIQLFKLYKIGYLSVDSETIVVFLWETPMNRPSGIITFFAITQEGVDQSFSSSNSTHKSMRRFYAQNFITIGLAFEDLSCKRPDILTDSRVYSLFEYTKSKPNSMTQLLMYKTLLSLFLFCSYRYV